MQIKIEIDVKPDELRRFLGLPDVAGLQDDVVRFLREKVGAASESFDPSVVLQGSLDLIRRNPTWKLLRGAMGRDRESGEEDVEVEVVPMKKPRAASKKAAAKKPRAKRAAKKDRSTTS